MDKIINSMIGGLIQKITDWILEGIVYIYTNVTGLRLNVTQFMTDVGIVEGMESVTKIMFALAWVIYFISIYTMLMNMLIASTDGSYKVSWSNIIKKIIVGAGLIMFSMKIVDILFNSIDSIWADFMPRFMPDKNLTIDGNLLGNVAENTANSLIGLVLAVGMAYNVFTASLNQIERFITIYIWYYISPLAMGFYASSENDEVPKKYILSLFLQTGAIFANQMLFWMFGKQLNHLSSAEPSKYLINFFIAFSILSLAKNSEKILNGLGFHTLPAPTSAKDIFAGLAAAKSAFGMAKKTAGAAVGAAVGGYKWASGKINEGKYKPESDNTSMTGSKAGKNGGTKTPTPASTTGGRTGTTTKDGTRPLSDKELAKKAQEDNFQTKFDKDNQTLIGTGQFGKSGDINAKPKTQEEMAKENENIADATKQVASELGNTKYDRKNPRNSYSNKQNKQGLEATKAGMQEATEQYRQALENTNKFLQNKDPQSAQNTLSNEDASKALNLEKTLPNFVPNPGGSVRKEANGDFTIHGTKVEQTKDGVISRPASYTFSSENRAGVTENGLKYSSTGLDATSDGNIKAYETTTAPAAPLPGLEKAESDGRAKRLSGKIHGKANTDAVSYSANVMNDVFKPKETLNGSEITSAGYMTDNGYLFFQARMPNRDGSYDNKMLMYTDRNVNNGEYVEGYVATGRQYSIPNEIGGNDWVVEMKEPTSYDYKNMASGSKSAAIQNDTKKVSEPDVASYKNMHDEIANYTSDSYIPVTNADDAYKINEAMENQFPTYDRRAEEEENKGFEPGNENGDPTVISETEGSVVHNAGSNPTALHRYNKSDDLLDLPGGREDFENITAADIHNNANDTHYESVQTVETGTTADGHNDDSSGVNPMNYQKISSSDESVKSNMKTDNKSILDNVADKLNRFKNRKK